MVKNEQESPLLIASSYDSVNFGMGEKSGLAVVQRKLGKLIAEVMKQGGVVSFSNLGLGAYNLLDIDSKTGELVVTEQTDQLPGVSRDLTAKRPVTQPFPVVNEKEVLELARNKREFYSSMEDLVAGVVSVDGDNFRETSELISNLYGDQFVLKPSTGNDSKGVQIGDKRFISDHISNPENFAQYPEGWIVQQKIGSTELPGVKGITPGEDEILKHPAYHKEMRVFVFVNGVGGYDYVPIARLFRKDSNGKSFDEFVYIDPASVPDEAMQLTREISNKITVITGVPYLYAAIDVVYGAVSGQDKRWYCMEANVKEPVAVNPSSLENAQREIDAAPVLKDHREKTAGLLIDIKNQKHKN